MFVLVEKMPGAFTLRLVSNDEVIAALRSRGSLQQFLHDADELYVDFRRRCQTSQRCITPTLITFVTTEDGTMLDQPG